MKIGDTIYWIADNITDRSLITDCIIYASEYDIGIVPMKINGLKNNKNRISLQFENFPSTFSIDINEINIFLFSGIIDAKMNFENFLKLQR